MCGSQHLIWNFIQPNTRLSLCLSPVLCIPSLFLYNVIIWREIRGGRAASALMSSCLSLCSSVGRILCLLWFFSDNYSQFHANRKHRGSISFSGAPDPRPWASVCVRLCMRWQLHGCLPVCRGGRKTEMERREEWRGRVLIMRGERKGGRAVCSEVRERARKKKEKAAGKRGEEDTATAYRCWRLRQRSAALSGHRKMVSVRGELTVAYNLMFSILDSFSMGNATARNSRAPLPFLLFSPSIYYPALLLLPRTHVHQTRSHSPVGVRSRRIARV